MPHGCGVGADTGMYLQRVSVKVAPKSKPLLFNTKLLSARSTLTTAVQSPLCRYFLK